MFAARPVIEKPQGCIEAILITVASCKDRCEVRTTPCRFRAFLRTTSSFRLKANLPSKTTLLFYCGRALLPKQIFFSFTRQPLINKQSRGSLLSSITPVILFSINLSGYDGSIIIRNTECSDSEDLIFCSISKTVQDCPSDISWHSSTLSQANVTI